MLIFSLYLACAEETAPPAPTDTRKHHAAVPVPPAEEAGEEEEDRTFGGGNREPLVRAVRVQPAQPSRMDTMQVTVNATDPENDSLTTSYEWSVNGQRVYGPDVPTFELKDYERGDTVSVTVRVRDGVNEVHATSDAYQLVNADPRFEGKPTEMRTIEGTRLEATDPDGDTVTFKMSGGPAGLTLDARGTLHYTGSETEPGGRYTLKIVAEDGQGGATTLELPLTLSAGSKAPAAAPPAG